MLSDTRARLKLLVATLTLASVAAADAAAQNPDGLAPSHLREAVVTFPEGVSLSPGAADGLVACPDAQLKLDSSAPDECPPASRIGTAEIHTHLLDDPLTGIIVVRPSIAGERFRIAITASGTGVHVKIPGAVRPDPVTGQVTAAFANLPQLPFSTLRLRFKGGPRAVLANPPDCGTYGVKSVFTPWSGTAPVTRTTLFDIGGDCPRQLPFDPVVTAGTVNPVAGVSTPVSFRVRREDRNQELGRIAVTLPPGVTAVVRGVPRCGDAAAGAGACPEASRIGSATIGAGAGTAPLYLGGKVFLTEGYRGGQFGLAIVVPAVAGPFDLGTVVVRAAVHVDPTTAQLRVESDPLPRILEGVPLRLRDVHLAIDRSGFTRNPTSCEPMEVRSTIGAVQGASAAATNRFQVGDCAALPFAPRMSVALTGPGPADRDRPLGLRAHLRARGGHANLETVAFTLPPEVAFDALRRGPGLCTREELAARRCPARSRVGSARAVTPLLDRPLSGPVYFIRGVRGDRFPKLAMLLDGEVRIDLLGSTDVNRRGLRTTFGVLPDVPLSDFKLALGRGLLTPTRDLCARRPRARLVMKGHNGRRLERRLAVGLPCKPSPRLRIRSARWTGAAVALRGTLKRGARRDVRVTVRCGRARIRRGVDTRRGRFATTVPVPQPCDGPLRLSVSYPGDRKLSTAFVARTLRRSG